MGSVWGISGQYTVRNCLISNAQVTTSYGLNFYNNTLVASGFGGSPFYFQFSPEHGSEYVIRNNLVYGYKGPMYQVQNGAGYAPGPSPKISHNQTDMANAPDGFTTISTAASQFVDPSKDFRLKAGALARGAAVADVANGAKDVSGLARPQGGKWDVGCWQSSG